MKYRAEPRPVHGHEPDAGVLLVNLGTPDAPTAKALRRYLAQFLSDPRVVEIPRVLWWPILHGIVLRLRPARSAARYADVWSAEGSPLAVWTARQAELLAAALVAAGRTAKVLPAMRYGRPSIGDQLDALRAHGVSRVLILPLYPQYAGATSGSVFDALARWGLRARWVPQLRFVQQYHDDPLYIAALKQQVEEHWRRAGRGKMLVMSFHGLPARSLELGDPYHGFCQATGRLLAERLGLAADEYRVTFQSRFGKARWLQPYTEPTLIELARQGMRRVDVICPGFVTDCLETLEEIDQQAREAFMAAGGEQFHYIACLNDQPAWIDALRSITLRHLQGWESVAHEAGASRHRALALDEAD